MALGEEILQTFIGNHKGDYKSSREGQKINFRIQLPTVKKGN
jgi:nitrogen-specific signal transduction histidine kinase